MNNEEIVKNLGKDPLLKNEKDLRRIFAEVMKNTFLGEDN